MLIIMGSLMVLLKIGPRRSSSVSFSKFSVVSYPRVKLMIPGESIELLEMGILHF